MKYTLFGFSQKLMVENNLNISDAAVLRFIIDFYHSGKMKKIIMKNHEYVWVNYKYISQNLPILNQGFKSKTDRANKRRVTSCINNLSASGIIEKKVVKNITGTFIYIRIIDEEYSKYLHNHEDGNPVTTTKVTPVTTTMVTKDSSININSSINDSISIEFEKFWNMYDKKSGRKKCLPKWKKLKDVDKEKIFQTLPTYIKSTPDKQYRKNPSTYLNNESWNDEVVINDNQDKGMKKDGFTKEYYEGNKDSSPGDFENLR